MLSIPQNSPYFIFVSFDNIWRNLLNNLITQKLAKIDLHSTFITLIHIERAMDAYRILLPPGSGTEHKNDKDLANKSLDELRQQIHILRSVLDDEEVKKTLNQSGEDFKLRFLKRPQIANQ